MDFWDKMGKKINEAIQWFLLNASTIQFIENG